MHRRRIGSEDPEPLGAVLRLRLPPSHGHSLGSAIWRHRSNARERSRMSSGAWRRCFISTARDRVSRSIGEQVVDGAVGEIRPCARVLPRLVVERYEEATALWRGGWVHISRPRRSVVLTDNPCIVTVARGAGGGPKGRPGRQIHLLDPPVGDGRTLSGIACHRAGSHHRSDEACHDEQDCTLGLHAVTAFRLRGSVHCGILRPD